MKELFDLFFIFAKMGAVNFGGGYALLPVIERELVEKRNWASLEEIQDYFAVGQCTPGVISVNVATFIGFKRKGILGGIFATLGFVFVPIIIILLLATIITKFQDNKYVQYAFNFIRICVFLLILKAVVGMIKKSIVDIYSLIIFLLVLALAIFTNISSVFFVLGAGILGIIINLIKEKVKMKKYYKEKNNIDSSAKEDKEDEE